MQIYYIITQEGIIEPKCLGGQVIRYVIPKVPLVTTLQPVAGWQAVETEPKKVVTSQKDGRCSAADATGSDGASKEIVPPHHHPTSTSYVQRKLLRNK